MSFDLSNMSHRELVDLRAAVEKEIVASERKKKKDALQAAQAAAAEYGFTLAELTGRKGLRPIDTSPKYRNPEDPTQTWSGFGRRPSWVNRELDDGKELSDLEI